MAVSNLDFTNPDLKFTYDLRNNLMFKKNNRNYINALGIDQLNTIGNVFLLDVFLSKNNLVEPHYHQNATELIYCITGSATASFINPFTNELKHFPITPGQVANIPQGWWHYVEATADGTHLLAIHDTPSLQTVFGSDIFRITPPQVLAHTYCLDENKVKNTFKPIHDTVIIGPPNDCGKRNAPIEQEQLAKREMPYYVKGQNYYVHP
jgi:quercetin dioxygenase-like cupin family protein